MKYAVSVYETHVAKVYVEAKDSLHAKEIANKAIEVFDITDMSKTDRVIHADEDSPEGLLYIVKPEYLDTTSINDWKVDKC